MQHIVIHYAGAFDDFDAIADDRHFFIDGRWSQQTTRGRLIRESALVNAGRGPAKQPVYAIGYNVLGVGDDTLHEMPYIVTRDFLWSFTAYEHNITLSRKRPDPTYVYVDGVLKGTYKILEIHGTTIVRIKDLAGRVDDIQTRRTAARFEAARVLSSR